MAGGRRRGVAWLFVAVLVVVASEWGMVMGAEQTAKAKVKEGAQNLADQAKEKVEDTTHGSDQKTWGETAADWARSVADFGSKEDSGKAQESVKDAPFKVVDEAGDRASESSSYMNDILKQATDQLSAMKDKVSKIVSGSSSDAQEKLQESYETAKGSAHRTGSEGINRAKEKTSEATEGVKQTASEAAEKVKGATGSASGKVGGSAKDAAGSAQDLLLSAKDRAAESATGASESAKQKAREATESAKQKAREATDTLKNVAGSASEKVTSSAGDTTGSAKDNLRSAGDKLSSAADHSKETLNSAKGTAAEHARPKEEHVQAVSGLADKIKQTVTGKQNLDHQEL